VVDETLAAAVEQGMSAFDDVIELMKKQMEEGKFLLIFMNATPLQQAMHMLTLAWCHLKSLIITEPRVADLVGNIRGPERDALLGENSEAAYYYGRSLSARFYIEYEFPRYFGAIESLLRGGATILKAKDPVFTGALAE
jgi:hypothetical protein